MTAISWTALASAVLLVLGLVLLLAGRRIRLRRGLGGGKTVSLVRITLTSPRLGLTGRPDRLIRQGGMVWPEEWKSSRQVRPSHRAQLGVYFLLSAQRKHAC
jgi:CRISPR-associated exonuclease Cas4